MFTELFLLGFGLRVQDIRDRNKKDKVMLETMNCRPLEELNKVHEILSCLIKGVYASDKVDDRVEAYKHWTSVGYEHVKLDVFNSDQQLTSDRVRIGDLQGRTLAEGDASGDARRADLASVARMMLFRRSAKCRLDKGALNTAGGGPDRRIPLPEYVVAIRGTIIQSNRRSFLQNIRHEEDMWADAKVVSEIVHAATDLYEPVFRLVLAIYQQCGSSVWVTGHSLGAMIALLATRKLALSEERIVLPTHLFNQPNVSLDVVAKIVAESSIKGIKKVFKPIVSEQIQEAIGEYWNEIDAKVTKHLRKWTEKIADKVAPNYGEQLKQESRDLVSRGYSPYLYVNPEDPICSEYIRHFRVSHPAGLRATLPSAIMSKSSVVLQMLSVNAYTSHLVPQGHLIVNNWALGPKQAHKLHQWYLYPTKDLKVHRVPVSAE
ncbi:hypothetical protein KC19_4G193500 [Ceratodon purpureus]|uniref:Fungal lipase-type domain-containing protein n=1 Tax=Ceratodon purpureus TaxID=3225 RepID=A0A8T0IBB0_CERPU|nr:hypothetical protein KC19_4G193500 [Ceratodon purpureus]